MILVHKGIHMHLSQNNTIFQVCTPVYLVAKNITCRSMNRNGKRAEKNYSRVIPSRNIIFVCLC